MKGKINRKSLTEKLIHNDKILMILCLLVSVVLWATVKINYSDDTVRTVSDIKANIGQTAEELDFTAFINEEDLLVDVEVTGKAYNINAHALTKDDIIVEAASTFIDSAGYKVVTLSARIADAATANDFEITKISPGIIIVPSNAANNAFFPLNSSLAKAKAEITVTIKDKIVDTTPTNNVFTNKTPKLAVVNAST